MQTAGASIQTTITQTVFFRVDIYPAIGSGHLQRCLALAAVFNRQDWQVTFLLKKISAPFATLIPSWAETLFFDNRFTETQIADSLPVFDLGIVDHYGLTAADESALFTKTTQSFVIDDLANRNHAGHWLLDQNYYPDPAKRYLGKVQDNTHFLFGPKYALLREEFKLAARAARSTEIPNIFVCYGGTDSTGETLKAVDALLALSIEGKKFTADIVVGKSFPQLDSLNEKIKNSSQFMLHIQSNTISDMMKNADLSVGAGGTMIWERAACGIASIVTCIAQNQEEVSESWAQLGCHINLGPSTKVDSQRLKIALTDFFEHRSRFLEMGERSKLYCDGAGAERVFTELTRTRYQEGDVLVFSRAQLADSKLIFDWRNNPLTRAASHQTSVLEWDSHVKWFQDSLKNPNREIFIAQFDGVAVGSIRRDFLADHYVLSWMVSPDYQGQGIGKAMLKQFVRLYPARYLAEIKDQNLASIKMVQAAGFTLHQNLNGFQSWLFEKSAKV